MKAIFITVRTGSKRLANKCLLKINGTTTIEHLIRRVKKSKKTDLIVLCTSNNKEDDVLCDIAVANNIDYYRGSSKDKLERWNGACNKYQVNFFVTADGDDLFCDPELIDKAFNQYDQSEGGIDFIKSNDVICGSFTYAIKSDALKKVCSLKDTDDTEMMWVYFTETGLFRVEDLQDVNHVYCRDDIRMTLDYDDDYKFFKKIIEHFGDREFSLKEIIEYIDLNPDVKKINYHCHQEWKNNQKMKTKLLLKS